MAGGTLAALDAIELISGGLADKCDIVIGILADEETRVARIMARDGIDREAALLRVRAQRDARYFIDNCDCIVENNGSAAEFTNSFLKALEECRHG